MRILSLAQTSIFINTFYNFTRSFYTLHPDPTEMITCEMIANDIGSVCSTALVRRKLGDQIFQGSGLSTQAIFLTESPCSEVQLYWFSLSKARGAVLTEHLKFALA